MVYPTINLNGTTAAVLLEQYRQASTMVCEAIAAVVRTEPNGRDYLDPSGDGRLLNAAQFEHSARMRALQGVYRDMQALAEHAVDSLAEG